MNCFLFKKAVWMLPALLILLATGCNREGSLAEAAAGGDIEAQYELAVFYSEQDPPQKTKSYEWMKRAAASRYTPAMKKLAEYYLIGYGTPVNYPRVSDWLTRYYEHDRNSADALAVGRKILIGASSRADVIAGFILFRIALNLENQSGTGDSELATAAGSELLIHAQKFFSWLLAARNYADAGKVMEFVDRVTKEYPVSFPENAAAVVKKMNADYNEHLEK